MFSYILIFIAMESWTLSLLMAGPESKLETTDLSKKSPKSPRKIIEPRVLEIKVCLIADTFT